MEINKYIDHTILKATATKEDVVALCKEAKEYSFFSVCVNSSFVPLAKKELEGTDVKVCTVVGFPLGAMSTEAKVFETQQALKDGAEEVDMVINIGELKSKNFKKVEEEIAEIKKATGDMVLKVIIETCYLTPQEIVLASEIAVKAKADFVKTSTGFGNDGARLENIELMRNAVDGKAKLKASGGIKNLDTALSFIEAGVDRIGTSSGVSIVKELKK
ncbi:deoxyribose-phosphate aldolase [Salinimicrobium tongyeongense]|uniref:Deoxyribose-phosphate aldolase n=1 Tax=Salinimicrobium tongyeongense TaxID=2809707 RepID=A0ABY6NUY9_9FLAO|nr:deoxyribose-phosphate aldolase [Salinimicrobium tongyeongense]UZH56736.1 deoxyribose-phosphate aldolase [Salinimicrobium tongyeongense]